MHGCQNHIRHRHRGYNMHRARHLLMIYNYKQYHQHHDIRHNWQCVCHIQEQSSTKKKQLLTVNTRHGTISYYFINCSAQRARDKQTVTLFQYQLAMDITVNLFHHNTLYQCCVSAVNQAGVSTPLCKLIITSEAGKTRVSLAIITGFLLLICCLTACIH